MRVLLLSIFLLTGCGASMKKTRDNVPMLGEYIHSPRYQLIKVSGRPGLFWNNYKTVNSVMVENYVVDIKQLLTEQVKNVPDVVLNYFSSLKAFESEVLLFTNVIKDEDYYSSAWTNKDHIMRITGFEKTSPESDLNTYLGPFSSINTSWNGIATYHLKFDDEVLKFKGYASRSIFSLRKKYRAYFKVFLPSKKHSDKIKALILSAYDPNNYLDDNGTYVLIPLSQ